jgi:autotransporter translocation and assembly factor TamB
MKRFTAVVLATFVASGLLIAQQQLTGKWEGLTPNREPVVLDLVAKGADVNGTMTVGEQKASIENGKISKNRFTFSVAIGGGAEAFTGELAESQIRIWMDDRGPGSAITLKRAAPPAKK